MHTLTATLTAAQQSKGLRPFFRLTFSLAGEDDVVIEQDRIASPDIGGIISGIETSDSQTAQVVFNNADWYFNSLDLKGWQVVIERGLRNAAGTVEYDAMPPMKVVDMDLLSSMGPVLRCTMSFIGIPDLLKEDKASKNYFNHWSNTKTVKTLLTEIADGNAVDIALTEQQTTSDDFLTMPVTIGTTDTSGTVKTTAGADNVYLAIQSLGTGEITRGTTLTIAGDATVYTVVHTVAISGNEATVELDGGLAVQATAGAVVTLTVAAGSRTVVGNALIISNRTVTTVTFKLKKVGLPGGNVTFTVTQDDGGSVLASKTVATSEITTGVTYVTVTLTTPLLVNERVWLTCQYTAGDASNYVCVAISTSQVKANEALVDEANPDASASPDKTWEDKSQNCAYKYTYTGGTGETNGVDCFEHCTAYVVVYDSEDSLIDVYIPADGFQIVEGTSRLEALDTLLRFTGCVRRFGVDGKIHVLVPVSALVTTWTSPTGFTAGPWTSEALAYDGDTGTYALQILTAIGWSDYLELTHAALSCDQIKFYALQTLAVMYIDIDVYDSNDAAWVDVYEGTYTASSWVTKSLDKRRTVTKARIRFYDGVNAAWQADVMEFMFGSDNYDYLYSLGRGFHEFFAKSVRNELIIPNMITVHSYDSDDDQYSGSATDATSYALVPIEKFIKATLTSDAQATSIAAAMIAQLVMSGQRGSATVPINLGAEIYDFVKVTDSRQSDSRTGNLGYIKWWWIPGKEYKMAFSFGQYISRPIGGPHFPHRYEPLGKTPLEAFQDGQLQVNATVDETLTDAGKVLDYLVEKQRDADANPSAITVESIAAQIVTALVGYLKNLVEDTSPQLGGDLDLNGKNIDFPTTPNISDCLDEDTMASNSATKLATQQSIKAYSDTKLANVVEDTTPQLGGQLEVNGQNITGIKTGINIVTASRAFDTQYTNNYGYPIFVTVDILLYTTSNVELLVAGSSIQNLRIIDPNADFVSDEVTLSFVVPIGATYKLVTSGTVPVKGSWVEITIGT